MWRGGNQCNTGQDDGTNKKPSGGQTGVILITVWITPGFNSAPFPDPLLLLRWLLQLPKRRHHLQCPPQLPGCRPSASAEEERTTSEIGERCIAVRGVRTPPASIPHLGKCVDLSPQLCSQGGDSLDALHHLRGEGWEEGDTPRSAFMLLLAFMDLLALSLQLQHLMRIPSAPPLHTCKPMDAAGSASNSGSADSGVSWRPAAGRSRRRGSTPCGQLGI